MENEMTLPILTGVFSAPPSGSPPSGSPPSGAPASAAIPAPSASPAPTSGAGGGNQVELSSIFGWNQLRILAMHAFVIGVGSIGRPLCTALASLGIRQFTICDPKRYRAESVAGQCETGEVGQHKVRCVARELRAGGASVVAWPSAVENIEPGWAGSDSVVVVCGDNLGVQRAAHDLAFLLRLPLFKVNLEPMYLLGSIRVFDYTRDDVDSCLLCPWTSAFFALQKRAVSCDGFEPSIRSQVMSGDADNVDAKGERRTASPRALGVGTAAWAAMVIASAIAREGSFERLHAREFLLTSLGPTLTENVLPGNADCRADHSARGDLLRVRETPDELSLADLVSRAGFGAKDARDELRIGGLTARIVLRACCVRCGADRRGCWWLLDPRRPVGRCSCGGSLREVPYFTEVRATRADLGDVWTEPLAHWGVGRKAAVTMSTLTKKTTIVLN